MGKVIFTAALTGNIHTPSMSPYLPVTPEELIEEAVRCEQAGAAVVHVHAREPEDGRPSTNVALYKEILSGIKTRSNVVVSPTTGGTAYPTMTFFGQLLRPGERTLPLQQTSSLVCFPFQGSGHSIVGGKRLDWERFDAVAVPGGEWCEHVNDGNGDAILFVVSDEPTLKSLGFYRKFGRAPDGDVRRIA